MRQRIRSHVTYANVMATIAVFLVLSGGTAVALTGSNTVFSDDIVNGEVKAADIGSNAVGSSKIVDGGVQGVDILDGTVDSPDILDGAVGNNDVRKNAITSGKVQDESLAGTDVLNDSLTGLDVAESSLGKVPSASSADSVNGKTASQLEGARAYAYMGGSCTPFCVLPRNKGVAYIVSIGSGRYCVGINGINAADPQSVALASAATTSAIGHHDAEWKISNQGCVPAEFEIKTEIAGLASNAVPFTIVIP